LMSEPEKRRIQVPKMSILAIDIPEEERDYTERYPALYQYPVTLLQKPPKSVVRCRLWRTAGCLTDAAILRWPRKGRSQQTVASMMQTPSNVKRWVQW
jgi:hypothetical protein